MAGTGGPPGTITSTLRGGGRARWQLGRRARQVVLLSHVVAGGCWLGLDVAFGILVLVARRADGGPTAAAAVLAIASVAGWPLAGVALVTALLTATTLAVVKPGGRPRSRRRPAAVAEAEQDPEQTAGRR